MDGVAPDRPVPAPGLCQDPRLPGAAFGAGRPRMRIDSAAFTSLARALLDRRPRRLGYPRFTAVFQSGGTPRRVWRASKPELRRELQKLLGGGDELTLRGPALREYERARKLAQDMGTEMALLRLTKLENAAHKSASTVEEALDYYSRATTTRPHGGDHLRPLRAVHRHPQGARTDGDAA
jgi:hypothetical protein